MVRGYLLDIIRVHDDQQTEKKNSNNDIKIFKSSSDSWSKHLREPLLNTNKSLFWIHLFLY